MSIPITCPHCEQPLSETEIQKIWASFNGSKTSEKKKAAAAANGKKGGRPKGMNPINLKRKPGDVPMDAIEIPEDEASTTPAKISRRIRKLMED